MGEWERGRMGEGANAKARGGAKERRGDWAVGLHCTSLRKTAEVLRFCDHGGAADLYKSGNRRGICLKTLWDFSCGAVGILINGAQRAGELIDSC